MGEVDDDRFEIEALQNGVRVFSPAVEVHSANVAQHLSTLIRTRDDFIALARTNLSVGRGLQGVQVSRVGVQEFEHGSPVQDGHHAFVLVRHVLVSHRGLVTLHHHIQSPSDGIHTDRSAIQHRSRQDLASGDVVRNTVSIERNRGRTRTITSKTGAKHR